MRKITIDFTSESFPLAAGRIGEHNATEITVVKPADLTGASYALAFSTNGKVIHSKFFNADEEIRLALWSQLTQDDILYVQLEAYDESGEYLGKSAVARLIFSYSVHGAETAADTENLDEYSDVLQNTLMREMLEDNIDTLNKLTTSASGNLLFDGKEIEGGTGLIGATFTPSVDDEGNISWTNDRGLQNPETVNIRGVSGVYVGSGKMPDGYNVQIDPSGKIEKEIPDYWQTALDKGAEAVNKAVENAGKNKSAFFFYTDAHWGYGSAMSPKLLKYLCENTAINKINFGGDFCNTYNVASDSYMSKMREWKKAIRNLPNHHSVIGNHDADITELKSEAQRYGFLLASEETNDIVHGDYFHYYIDNQSEKTRYIYLDTGLLGISPYTVSDESAQFTVDALNTTPDGWHIVVISHIWFNYNSTSTPTVGTIPAYCQGLLDMFDAYNARSSGSVTARNTAVSYDFASAKGRVEFCVGGHIHVDHVVTSANKIPVILTQTDSYHTRGDFRFAEGTATEASVSGIVADYDSDKISVVRVGRGSSFEVVISTGKVTEIPDDSEDDNGETPENPETPDTPETPEIPPVDTVPDNVLFDDAELENDLAVGYKSNCRISGGDGTETTNNATGCVTGFIPVAQGNYIYLKDVTMPDVSSSYHAFVGYYDADMAYIKGYYMNSGSGSNYNVAYDANGNLKQFKIDEACSYIRICAQQITDSSIITVDEPIEKENA